MDAEVLLPHWDRWGRRLREGLLTCRDTAQLVHIRARAWTQVFRSLGQRFPFLPFHINAFYVIRISVHSCVHSLIHSFTKQMCIEDPLCARYSAGCWGHVDGLGRGPALRNFTVWLRLESRLCVLLPQNQVHCEVKGLLDGALGPVYLFIFFSSL